jgi:hypothetical protein
MVFMKELVKDTGGFLSYSSITFFFLGLFFCENGEIRTVLWFSENTGFEIKELLW